MGWYTSVGSDRVFYCVGCVPADRAGRFTRFLNHNPLSLEFRWRFHLWATRDKRNRWRSRVTWRDCVMRGCKPLLEVLRGFMADIYGAFPDLEVRT